MEFTSAKVYTEKNFSEHLVIGHPYYPVRPAFLLIKKGFIKLREQINVYDLGAYSIILVDSNSVYEIREISEDIELIIIAYDRAFVDKLNFKFNRLNAYRAIRTEFKTVYNATENEFNVIWGNLTNLKYYIDSAEDNEYGLEVIETLFTALIYQFGNIISRNRKLSKKQMTRAQEISLEFIKLVSAHHLQERSVEFYAQQLMLSTRHLTTVLKQILGKGASEIIAEFLLNDAKAQLSSTKKTINEIANELNFSDQYSFSHFFKKHENISPSDYRKQF